MSPTILQIQHLTKRYGALEAVKDLTLAVYEGEIFGFLGPNGAGKTTTIHMLCGLLKPDAGQVLLRGRPVVHGCGGVRSWIGICPQRIILWERLTCLEQLQFIGEQYEMKSSAARRRAEALLEALGLAAQCRQLAGTLSGGMQRRLNLALALMHDPELLVLDEPEAGLDPQGRVLVREYIRCLARQPGTGRPKTIVLTTHNMDEADRIVDRVAIIDHGKLLVLDTPAALKQSVGQGDTVEIRLAGGLLDEVRARQALQAIGAGVRLDAAGPALHVRALHAVGQLADILERLSAAGFQPGEVSIRSNTLEDVFIQLTGRRLRE